MAVKLKPPTESEEAKDLVEWWGNVCRICYHLPPEVLIHIPNEAKRSYRTAAKLKAEGMRTGTPDYFLAVACGPYHGLWLELKRAKGGRLSDAQKAMLRMLYSQGYAVAVAHGFEEARAELTAYLDQTNKRPYQCQPPE